MHESAGHLGSAAVRAGAGIREHRFGHGVVLEVTARRGGRSSRRYHPFEVIPTGTTTGGSPRPLVKVFLDSWLSKDWNVDSKVTITGLGEPFEIDVDQAIYLKVAYADTGDIDAVTLEHGDYWDEYPRRVAFDDPDAENKRQTFAYELIAYTQAFEEDDPYTQRAKLVGDIQLVQCVFSNLRLCETCDESDTVMLMVPGAAPGPSFA